MKKGEEAERGGRNGLLCFIVKWFSVTTQNTIRRYEMPIIFYKVQAGQETTRGTAVAATAKWMAYRLRPKVGDRAIVQPVEDRGSKFGRFRGFTVSQQAGMGSLESAESGTTFEDILYPLLMALKGGVTPSVPAVTNDPDARLWTFAPTSGSADNPDTFTVEWGDDVQQWESEYCLGTALTINGAINEAWALSMPLVGRQHTPINNFTASLQDRAVESILTNKTILYMDDAGAGAVMGTTPVSNAFVGFTWNLGEHFAPKFTGEGNLYFSHHSEKKLFPTLSLDVIMTSAVATLITTKYQAETVQLVRLKGTGSTIGSNGVSLTRHAQIDGAYRIIDVSSLEEEDGLTRVTMELAAEYESNYAKLIEIAVQNAVATLP